MVDNASHDSAKPSKCPPTEVNRDGHRGASATRLWLLGRCSPRHRSPLPGGPTTGAPQTYAHPPCLLSPLDNSQRRTTVRRQGTQQRTQRRASRRSRQPTSSRSPPRSDRCLTSRTSAARRRCGPSAKRATREPYHHSSKHLLDGADVTSRCELVRPSARAWSDEYRPHDEIVFGVAHARSHRSDKAGPAAVRSVRTNSVGRLNSRFYRRTQ